MSYKSPTYPFSPGNVDQKILQPSPQFRREVVKVLAAILFFVLTYLLLVAAAVGFAVLCAMGGLSLVVFKPMFLTLMLGLGLAVLGLMVLIFMVKFLFKRHTIQLSGLTEITETEHPRLFEFVRTLAKETQTTFPRKIYVSPDVNASVFYNSSFWSMFFPVRKNLQIGLGLVNAVNLSEFKAILAHEFGHFSQRSMKLGTYVYNMNRIIFNMLYDNDGYESTLQWWSNASGYFTIFAAITVRIVMGIQWVLRQVYTVMNRVYMSLSRQMEFHADAVAASVTGANHLVRALRRLEVADTTFNNVLGFYRDNFSRGFTPENLYPQQREVMRLFAAFYGIPLEEGLPQVDAETVRRFNKSRVVVKDQWASHPSTDDREKHLLSLHLETQTVKDSAWVLFGYPEVLQQIITRNMFAEVQYEQPAQLIGESVFAEKYGEQIRRFELPAAYKGFFDNRNITTVDLACLEKSNKPVILESLLTERVLALPYEIDGIKSDIETLESIAAADAGITGFEMDGRKYKAREAEHLVPALREDLAHKEKMLAEADKQVMTLFLFETASVEAREELEAKYTELFLISAEADKDVALCVMMQKSIMALHQPMKLPQIQNAIAALKEHESDFRQRLTHWLQQFPDPEIVTEEQLDTTTEYLSKDWDYFRGQAYDQSALERLHKCLMLFYEMVTQITFSKKADVLRFQLQLCQTNGLVYDS